MYGGLQSPYQPVWSNALFADPQSVTIDTVAKSLPRTSVGDRVAVYTKDDELLRLTISHQSTNKGRTMRMARLDVIKISADPFLPAQNREVTETIHIVINEPSDGAFTNAEGLSNAKGLLDWLSDANVAKVLAGES